MRKLLFWIRQWPSAACALLLAARMPGAGAAVAPPASIRLAIVPESKETANLAALLTTELAKKTNVVLLERAEIDRVYQEQFLAAGTADYLKLGQILGAEGLLCLGVSTSQEQHPLTLKFIAVKPGVVLADERWQRTPAQSTPAWADELVKHLAPLIPKASVLPAEAIPLSIVSMRSTVQTEEGRELERAVTSLLAQRLSRERKVFVLERQKLRLLEQEKAFTPKDTAEFWRGAFLLEGIIDRDGYSPQTMTLSARLMPPEGRGAPLSIEVTEARTNVGGAVEVLAQRILAGLKVDAANSTWSSGEEAQRFFEDAQWAYRWGLLAQAQNASESAWAFGLHSEPVAQLRVRSYADAVYPVGSGFGNVVIPGLPEPEKLAPLQRALELFNQGCRMFFTDKRGLDDTWHVIGMHLCREALATLDSFYHWAGVCDEYAGQLAEIRASTRELEPRVRAQTQIDEEAARSNAARRYALITLHTDLLMYNHSLWNQGGLLFENPESSLPLFRSMLAEGYAPNDLPRLVGWSWEDKQKVPRLLEALLKELASSTSPPEKLGGSLLQLIKTPFFPEPDFHAVENALMPLLWECRDWLVARPTHAALLEEVESVLRKKYNEPDVNAYFEQGPFSEARFRLELYYLTTATNFDYELFQNLFPRSLSRMPPQEAAKLAVAMERFPPQRQYAAQVRDDFRHRAALATASNSPPIAAVLPAETPFRARFVRWKIARPPEDEVVMVRKLQVVHDRLTALLGYVPKHESYSQDPPFAWISIDPLDGKCEVVPLPEHIDSPSQNFAIDDDALWLPAKQKLFRYGFRERKWEALELPIERGASAVALSNRVYVGNSDIITEMRTGNRELRILASARRQPPVVEMDGLLGDSVHLYPRADGLLGMMVSYRDFCYSDTKQAWQKVSEVPKILRLAYWAPHLLPDGVLLRTENSFSRGVLARWDTSSEFEVLLTEYKSQPGFRTLPDTEKLLSNTRWDWPKGFDSGVSRIILAQSNLWILTPRKSWRGPGPSKEPIKFADERQATLFRFEPGHRQPSSVAIAFEPAGIEPFEPTQGGYGMMMSMGPGDPDLPFWLKTSAGLVMSEPELGGHWLIPFPQIQARMDSSRSIGATRSDPARVRANPTSATGQQNNPQGHE